MGFIETLNKFGHKISLNQTEIYKQIISAQSHLETVGIKVKIKNEFDLFDYEMIYLGMLTQNRIENAYEIFLNQHYDLLDYLNYEEKRKMFNNDILPILEKSPHFYDEKNKTEIYIPYLEAFMNHRYTHDYQILLLKQHKDYLKNYKFKQKTPVELYGTNIYLSDFSSLQNVYEDDRHVCFYYDPLKTIYVYKKETGELLNHIIITDHDLQDVHLEDVKVIAYDIETYLYKECLDFMKEKGFINDKTYKKVLKKYK